MMVHCGKSWASFDFLARQPWLNQQYVNSSGQQYHKQNWTINATSSHKTAILVKPGHILWKKSPLVFTLCLTTAKPRLCDSRRSLKATDRSCSCTAPRSVGVWSCYQSFGSGIWSGHQNQSHDNGQCNWTPQPPLTSWQRCSSENTDGRKETEIGQEDRQELSQTGMYCSCWEQLC